jgi:hypothetical protein
MTTEVEIHIRSVPCRDSGHVDGTLSDQRIKVGRHLIVDRTIEQNRLFANGTPQDESANQKHISKTPAGTPTGANMWMKNGERCCARWSLKDHAR